MADILIVEDDELLTGGLGFALRKEGYGVVAARSYKEGYSAWLSGGFDLVLLDINLPDQNGDVLLSEIRRTSDIPVIFITANDFKKLTVTKAGQPLKLTATEYKLLEMLVKHKGQVLTRQILLERVWDSEGNFVDENALPL